MTKTFFWLSCLNNTNPGKREKENGGKLAKRKTTAEMRKKVRRKKKDK